MNNLSHIEFDSNTGFSFFIFMNGCVGLSFYFKPLDAENLNEENVMLGLQNAIAELPAQVFVRFTEKQTKVFFDQAGTSREEAFQHVGRTLSERIMTFETWALPSLIENLNPFSKTLRGDLSTPKNLLLQTIQKMDLAGVGIKLTPLSEEETVKQSSLPEEIYKFEDFITLKSDPKNGDLKNGVVKYGAVRLKNLNQKLSLKSIAHLKSMLPRPFTMSVSFSKVHKAWAELRLRGDIKSMENSVDLTHKLKHQEADSHLDRLTQKNESLFSVEFIIGIEREREDVLKKDLNSISKNLSWLGESYVETIGTYPTYMATQYGEKQHTTFDELSQGVVFLLPVFSYVNSATEKIDSLRRARIHRRSGEVDSFDFFFNNKSGNTIIAGGAGRGKSFLVNLLTESVMQDPTTRMLKIDVGSSYVKECARLGGVRYSITLDTPSGLNPFYCLLENPHSLELCMILTSFLETFLLENGESVLPKENKIDLANEVIRYSLNRPTDPSLEDFYNFSNLARKKLLSQWVGDGMYKNIFKSDKLKTHKCDPLDTRATGVTRDTDVIKDIRYKYYDFESLHTAKNDELMAGTVAAVIAEYNTEIFKSGKHGPRVFLVCDETKFVFEKCSAFFHTTCANSRKYGHVLVLINQESNAFFSKDGQGELSDSLFVNSSNHFLFDVDKKEGKEMFSQRHKHLTLDEYEEIKSVEIKKGEFAEVFHKDDTGSRVFRIVPSLDEYWRWTTDKNDKEYIHRVTQEFNLTEGEVIACLKMKKNKIR
jgi:hypothetical protein